ncbi:MAG: hypothetical protein LAT65_08615 [Saccharospirillum sp.]|nr:hypothetical protein [Saccharospirillum sp.]
MTSVQWTRQHDEMAQSFRQYQRLHARGCPATQVVAVEQNWLRLLPGVLGGAEHLPESPSAADEMFAALWVSLCHPSPSVQQQGQNHLKQALDAAEDTNSPELFAVSTALHLALCSPLAIDWQAIAELCQPYTIAHPVLANLAWPETTTTPIANWWPEGLEAALQQLYTQHQADALLALADDHLTEFAILSLGLVLQLGHEAALPRLQSLADTHTETVLAAYWISGRRDATGQLLEALRIPHKAKTAARYWAHYSGQSLEWLPSMGIVGSDQKQGAEQPDAEPADQWWQQNAADGAVFWQGKPLTEASLRQALGQYWGRPMAPLWALWQFQQRKRLPDPLTQWHSDRLATLTQALGQAPQGADSASG